MNLFSTPAGQDSLPLSEERSLLLWAKHSTPEAKRAVERLVYQYRGALQAASWGVRKRVRGLSREQIEDLESELVLAAVEAIKSFDLDKYVRLSQVLPTALRAPAAEMTTALTIPSGTLARWFKVWRAADQDHREAVKMAPGMGMSADVYRAIQHSLTAVESEWVTTPFNPQSPTADAETYRLAHLAMEALTPAELDVIQLAFGFRGEPKSDDEVAIVLSSTRGTVKSQRQHALGKMRRRLEGEPR